MTYYPYTPTDRQRMLQTIGEASADALFTDIPAPVRFPSLDLPPGLSQMEISQEMAAV